MSECRAEVHVNDIGTLYRVRVLDNLLAFDPTLASVKQLIFQLPGGYVVTKDATVVGEGGSPATEWYLEYEVQASDGPGSPPAEFHLAAGKMKVQGYLEWADGSKFSSDIRTTDEDGKELKIFPNLA